MSFLSLRGRPTEKTEYAGIPECALPGQHSFIFDLFSRYVKPGARVIDLASGRGAWPKRLADAGYDVSASDIDPGKCEVACLDIDLNQDFAEHFTGTSIDAVSCIEMLEHIENPRHIFRGAAKMLDKDGVLILSTPNASGLHSRVKFLATGRFAQFDDEQYNSIGHIRPITFWELDKMLKETGFEIAETRFFNHYDMVPRTLGEVVKLAASAVLTPFVRGTAGGQTIVVVARKR